MLRISRGIGTVTILAGLVLARSRAGSPAEAGYAGDQACKECHQDEADSLSGNVHRSLPDHAPGEGHSCESCHGPGAEHVASKGKVAMFSYLEATSAADRSERCLRCHGERESGSHFASSPHAKGNVACSDCHRMHPEGGKLTAARPVELCAGCHAEVWPATGLPSRHRIHEGIVGCADCHDVHGRSSRDQLGGFSHEACLRCHTDKQGPFVFEHGASRIEGCVACHTPHGSTNRHLLTHQRVADLCLQCHVEVPGLHSRFTGATQCTNCHATIHGSHLDPFFLN